MAPILAVCGQKEKPVVNEPREGIFASANRNAAVPAATFLFISTAPLHNNKAPAQKQGTIPNH
jgi:hypothetical protein